jgi:hypothetical protein
MGQAASMAPTFAANDWTDINALSNFVADPVTVLGFDPHDRLIDDLVDRITAAKAPAGRHS